MVRSCIPVGSWEAIDLAYGADPVAEGVDEADGPLVGISPIVGIDGPAFLSC